MQNKSKKLTSRLLSALLALACVLTLLPGVAVAAETMTMLKKEEGSMVLEKGAVLEDDGTYTIQLSAYATGTTTMVPQESSVPLDIVLVLDQSGSMAGSNLTALRTAVTNFVQTIKENAEKYQVDHRIAVVGFAGAEYNSSNYYYANTELFIGKKQYNYIEGGKESTETAIASTQYANAFQVVTIQLVLPIWRIRLRHWRQRVAHIPNLAWKWQMGFSVPTRTPTQNRTVKRGPGAALWLCLQTVNLAMVASLRPM